MYVYICLHIHVFIIPFADIQGCRACVAVLSSDTQDSFADLQGSFADLQGSFADLQGSFADLQGSFADLQGSLADIQGSFVANSHHS